MVLGRGGRAYHNTPTPNLPPPLLLLLLLHACLILLKTVEIKSRTIFAGQMLQTASNPRGQEQKKHRDTALCIQKSLPPAKETCDGHLLGNGLWGGFASGICFSSPTVINLHLIIVTCISK